MNEKNTGGDLFPSNTSRRKFFKQSSALAAVTLLPNTILKAADDNVDEKIAEAFEKMPLEC